MKSRKLRVLAVGGISMPDAEQALAMGLCFTKRLIQKWTLLLEKQDH